tara:strand:- start:229 stop:2289 length:2061 start_codon:yes stop_codon:yes gene_type:complete
MENYNIPKLNLSESFSKQDSAWADAIKTYEKENRGRKFRDLPEAEQQLYFMKALGRYGLTMNSKGYIVRASKINKGTPMNESVKALAEHVKKQVPLCDSIFRYQSEAYFDTFKTAKKLREAGSLPELDWESEEMLGTDIGESVELKGVGRVWLDVPYLDESIQEDDFDESSKRKNIHATGDIVSLDGKEYVVTKVDFDKGTVNVIDRDGKRTSNVKAGVFLPGIKVGDKKADFYNSGAATESIEEAEEGMIGEPDTSYDAEERTEAYNDLQDALQGNYMDDYIKDGSCPACAGSGYMDGEDEVYNDDTEEYEEGSECDGFGNYGCDEGEMTYGSDGPSWVEIIKHDKQQADRKDAIANYPGDEVVIKQAAKMMPNMDDPRMIVQQIRTDYPQLGRAKASDLAGKAKQIAFPESVEIDQIRNLAGLNELKDKQDERTDVDKIADLLKDAIGPDARGEDMYELYAELESMDSEKADEVKLIAKEIYGVRLEEGKSPHKKGTKKYKKHMAAMHAEDLEEKALKDVGGDDIVTVKMGGVDREFIRKGDEWESTDQKNYPMKFKVGTPTHDKLLNIQRKKQMARSTPSAQARRKLKVMASEAEYQGKDVELNKPKRGGSKKYYVYVKTPKGNVKKISFGDVTGLKAKAGNKKAAKSFAARHNCEKKNDKQKAGYWACRLPRYGLVKGGKWW